MSRAHVLFYRLADGVLTGREYSGPDDMLAANTPADCGAIDALLVTNRRTQRVDLATGDLVAYQPPAPADTADWTHTWDVAAGEWVASPTTATLWRRVRAERDRRLAATDWVALRGLERGEPIPKAWRDYRQALRDVPQQADPKNINWPTPPAE